MLKKFKKTLDNKLRKILHLNKQTNKQTTANFCF